jgi:hypothetical protein
MALANSHKGSLSVAEYFPKMQSLSNHMAATGKPLDDEDLVQYILAGLDEDFDSVVNSILARSQAITVSELASQMLLLNLALICAMEVLDHLQISQSEVVVEDLVAALVTGEEAKVGTLKLQDEVVPKVVATTTEITQIVHNAKSVLSTDTLRKGAGIDLMKIMSLSKDRKDTQS